MTAKKQSEEQFIKGLHLETFYGQAKAIDSELWEIILAIQEHYREYSKHCMAIT